MIHRTTPTFYQKEYRRITSIRRIQYRMPNLDNISNLLYQSYFLSQLAKRRIFSYCGPNLAKLRATGRFWILDFQPDFFCVLTLNWINRIGYIEVPLKKMEIVPPLLKCPEFLPDWGVSQPPLLRLWWP